MRCGAPPGLRPGLRLQWKYGAPRTSEPDGLGSGFPYEARARMSLEPSVLYRIVRAALYNFARVRYKSARARRCVARCSFVRQPLTTCSRRRIAAPTRLSGVDAPDVRPRPTEPV